MAKNNEKLNMLKSYKLYIYLDTKYYLKAIETHVRSYNIANHIEHCIKAAHIVSFLTHYDEAQFGPFKYFTYLCFYFVSLLDSHRFKCKHNTQKLNKNY